MAGLLDFIKTPEGQGLLSAAFAGMAGAQRGTPWNNAGRAGVAGLMGYQGTIDRQQAEEKNALFNEQARLQVDELKRKNTDAQRTRDILKEIYGQQGLPQSPVSQGATGQAPSLLRMDASTPWGTPQTGSAGYTPPPTQKANGIPAKSSQYESYKGVADKLAAQGLIEQAKQYADMAEKNRPNFDTKPQKMVVNGKLMNVLVGTDGSVKTLDGYDVPPEMVSTELGGRVVWSDKNQIKPGQTMSKTATPGELMADARSREQFAFNKSQAGAKPQFHDGQWVYPPSQQNPQGSAVPVQGYTKSIGEAQRKQLVGIQSLGSAIDEYVAQLDDWNKIKTFSPNDRAMMGTKYNNMMLQAKEAYNLGVLNGPDYAILTSVITDPTTAKGAFVSRDVMSNQAKELKRIMGKTAEAARTGGASDGSAPPKQEVKDASQNQQALDWANANPSDPRAAAIKKRLGM